MSKLFIVLLASLFFTPLFGQDEIEVSNSGNDIVLSFAKLGAITTVNVSEINPYEDELKGYKNSALATSKMYIIEGQVRLKSLVDTVIREKYEPLPAGIEEIVTTIQTFDPRVYLSENKRFAVVVYNKLFKNNFIPIYASSTVAMYNAEGEIYTQFEFESSIYSAQLSNDGRYLLFSYEEGGEDMLVPAGFSIYDTKLKKIIRSIRLPKNSVSPYCSSKSNFLIISSKLQGNCILYFVFFPQNENMYSLNIDDISKYSELSITNDGFYFNLKGEPTKVDTFLFKRDFYQIIQDQTE